jgi:hypothetical protein
VSSSGGTARSRPTNNAVPAPLVDLERYRVVARLEEQVGQLFSARWVAGGQILTATTGTAQLWNGLIGPAPSDLPPRRS